MTGALMLTCFWVAVVIATIAGSSRNKQNPLVHDHGVESNLWLCGHSLGEAVATYVGDQMAKKGCFFRTFLLNPPYINNRRSKDGFLHKLDDIMEVAGDLTGGLIAGKFGCVGADLASVAKNLLHKDKEKKKSQQFDNMNAGDQAAFAKNLRYKKKQDQLQQFDNLNRWDPRVYVNLKDYLAKPYIKYFKNKKMKGSPNQLPKSIASATLVINLDKPGDELLHFKEAHSIMQWWKPGLRVEAKRYVMA